MVTRTYRVYGAVGGHRQRQSFGTSERHDFSDGNDIRIIELIREDVTGTNEYVDVRITRNTAEECEAELNGQLSDGFFENSRFGEVVFIEE